MKFTQILAVMAAVAGVAMGAGEEFTQEYVGEGPIKPAFDKVPDSKPSGEVLEFQGYENKSEALKQFMPEMKDRKSKFLGFTALYHIDGFEGLDPREFAELKNGQVIDVMFELDNKEEEDVIIVVGTGGVFRDINDLTIKANITVTPLERRIRLDPGDKHLLIQKVQIVLDPQSYIFTPQLFVMVNGETRLVQARAQMISVEDDVVSIIDPQLLLLELLLLVSFLGLAYLGYELWGKDYVRNNFKLFQGTSTKASKKSKEPHVHDKGWIPEGHLRQRKKVY